MLKVVQEAPDGEESVTYETLDAFMAQGARRMLLQALEAEVASYLTRSAGERDDNGHALVVRNGRGKPRTFTAGAGTFKVEAPRVNDKRIDDDGSRKKFTSKILPPYMRRSAKVEEVLPLLYLRGLSTLDFKEALPVLLGDDAAGLSPSAITRLTNGWIDECEQFKFRSLKEKRFVYVWADGIHLRIRLGDSDNKLCVLVMVGVLEDGSKELIALEDGYRESTDSWSTFLRSLKKRGMEPPLVAVGDGALGFWKAIGDVWPETRHQRDWFHKMSNVLDKLPKRLQGKAKAALREIYRSDTREDAAALIDDFEETFGTKHPRAAECLRKDEDALLTYFDFPAEHWLHLRTSNAIESTFATVRLRHKITKGNGNREKCLAMVMKLMTMAQIRWRKCNGAALLPLVASGVKFKNGKRVQEESNSSGVAA